MKRHRDRRLAIVAVVLAVAIPLAFALQMRDRTSEAPSGASSAAALDGGSVSEIDALFQQSVLLLRARHFPQALQQLEHLLRLAPSMPEAHVNMGYALIGMQRYPQAGKHFERATELNANQLNAYYGLALCYEHGGDLDAALGAMRVYVHLAAPDDPHAKKAWSAIWEWEAAREQGRG